jgi:uncharacterized protein (DUF849 family)
MAKHKVVMSRAISGSIHTPSMSSYLPVTASEVAESALGAAEAGAAIVHLRARNPEDRRPDQTLKRSNPSQGWPNSPPISSSILPLAARPT